MSEDDAVPGDGRDETETERADRKWEDVLQELRVIQTGVQLTAGFLLTLPFQERFEDLTTAQRDLYLGLVVLAAAITGLVLAPVAIHRRLSGRHVKPRIVNASHVVMRTVLVLMAVLVAAGGVIHGHDMPPSLQTAEVSGTLPRMSLASATAALEMDLIQDALKTSGGNLARTARLLDTTERIIAYKVKKLGIDLKRFRRE